MTSSRIVAILILTGSLLSSFNYAARAQATQGAATNRLSAYQSNFLCSGEGPLPAGAVRVTYLGTTMLMFDDGETQLLFDGFLTRPPLRKLLFSRIQTNIELVDGALARAGANRVKGIFVSHSHFDHALDVPYLALKTGAIVYGSPSTLNIARGGNVPESQRVAQRVTGEHRIGAFTVRVLPSKHSPPIVGINNDLGIEIREPLRQPASFRAYTEGGSFDFLVRHGGHTILVKPAANFVPGAFDNVRADVLFLATARLTSQSREFQNSFYEETVGKLRPKLVIPVHWDDFMRPLSTKLQPSWGSIKDLGFLAERLRRDHIRFGLLQGFQSTHLFADDAFQEAANCSTDGSSLAPATERNGNVLVWSRTYMHGNAPSG